MTAGADVLYPVNAQYYCLECPGKPDRMFERSVFDNTYLAGEGNWEGRLNGRTAVLTPDSLKEKQKGTFYSFKDGHLVSWTLNGRTTVVTNLSTCTAATLYPTDQAIASAVSDARKKSLWDGGARLRFLSPNPNVTGAILTSLLLVVLGLLVKEGSKVGFQVACSLALCAISWGILCTESRSSYIAVFAGGGSLIALSTRLRLRKHVVIGLAVFLVGLVSVAVFCFGSRFATALFHADDLRMDIFRVFPAMVADSPIGVGIGNSGAVYDVWYRDITIPQLVRTLVGSHQTLFVELSSALRIVYLTAWLFVLCASAYIGFRKRSGTVFGVWLALFVCGVFNPVFESLLVWVIPCACLVVGIVRSHEVLARRGIVLIFGGCVLAAVLLLAACVCWGKRHGHPFPFHVTKEVVSIKDANPGIWIVTDEFALGGWSYLGHEVLPAYEEDGELPSVAFVEDVRHLPDEVDRLVLAGRSIERYLETRNQVKQSGKPFCRARSVLLISPSVPVSALPKDFLEESRFRAVIGSLSLHYYEGGGLGELPKWVRVVPGARAYIPGWFTLALEF